MTRPSSRLRRAAVAAAAAAALAACSPSAAQRDGRLDVAAALYPLQFLAERIGGEAVRVQPLTPPGAEPHDLELTARQVADLQDADAVVYLSGLQPAVDAALEASDVRVLDAAAVTPLARADSEHADSEHAASDGHAAEEESGASTLDPHVWLDPVRMQDLAGAVAETLAAADPARAEEFRQRADRLRADLAALDGEFRAGLARCERRDLVTSHESFGYLARRYGLRQVGVSGLSPESEPSPRRLAEVAAYAREHGVRTIFFEEAVSPSTAQVLASEVGARAAVLSPLETAPAQGDYLTALRTDLAALREALSCR